MIQLGLFVIIALILFTIGVYNVGSKKNLFGSSVKISAEFQDIKGLLPGNNVRYSGLVVGAVESILIKNDSVIEVRMNIDKELKMYIKKNATASINSNGLVGDMIVNIYPGNGNEIEIQDGDILKTRGSVETQQMLSTLDQTNENILHISQNLKEITDKLNADNSLLTQLLKDDVLLKHIKETARNLELMSINLTDVSQDISSVMSNVNNGKGALGYLLNDNSFSEKTNHLLDVLDRDIISKTEPIITNLELASHSFHAISQKVDSLLSEVDLHQGMLGLLLKDSLATVKTHGLMDSLQRSTFLFNENMEALQSNFLFKGYFKKKRKREQNRISAN